MTSKDNIVFAKWWKICQDNISRSWNTSWQQQIHLEVKNTPWRYKVRHDVKRCVMASNSVSSKTSITSNRSPWHQICWIRYVSYDVISLLRCHKLVMDDFKKSVYPDFKMFVMMSKYVRMTNGSSLLQRVRHDVNKTSSRQKVCHRIKRFVMMSKNMPNVCHEIKNMSWCQKVWMYCLVTYIYTHTLTYNLIFYILIKCYIV